MCAFIAVLIIEDIIDPNAKSNGKFIKAALSNKQMIFSLGRRMNARTNTQAAINLMRNTVFSSGRGDRSNVPNYSIVVTDGGSNIDRPNTVPSAQQAKNAGKSCQATNVWFLYNTRFIKHKWATWQKS